MKYEKPKCECGSDLEYVEEYIYHHTQKINKNGELSKKIRIGRGTSYGTAWLKCTNLECDNCYEIEYDGNKIIRGDTYS